MTTVQMVPVDTLTFNESHLESSLKYIDPKGYPELYSNLHGGLKFIGRKLINMDDSRHRIWYAYPVFFDRF